MNRRLPDPALPTWNPPASVSRFTDIQQAIRSITVFMSMLTLYLRQTLGAIVEQLNTQVQTVGVTLASASVISPSAAIHHVTGVATISTINAPSGFSGPLWLIADGAWSTNALGNIARASTPALGQALLLVYDPATELWYPAL